MILNFFSFKFAILLFLKKYLHMQDYTFCKKPTGCIFLYKIYFFFKEPILTIKSSMN